MRILLTKSYNTRVRLGTKTVSSFGCPNRSSLSVGTTEVKTDVSVFFFFQWFLLITQEDHCFYNRLNLLGVTQTGGGRRTCCVRVQCFI